MTMRTHQDYNRAISRIFQYAVSAALVLLLGALLAAISWAAILTLYDLMSMFSKDIHGGMKTVMVNSLTILALLEVFMTTLAYFKEGRVKVTYIIDTVLVVILTEVMVFWFREIGYERIIMVIGLVLSLTVARIMAIRFSPAKAKNEI